MWSDLRVLLHVGACTNCPRNRQIRYPCSSRHKRRRESSPNDTSHDPEVWPTGILCPWLCQSAAASLKTTPISFSRCRLVCVTFVRHSRLSSSLGFVVGSGLSL